MKDIELPRVKWRVSNGPPGLRDCPGRNSPAYGVWMIENLVPPGRREAPVIADPMCGGGQLWVKRPPDSRVVGCEKEPSRARVAAMNGIWAEIGDALTWKPRADLLRIEGVAQADLVAFSFPYENCDHNSGNVKNDIVKQKGLQSMQDIGPRPDPLRVFTQIATWCGNAPVAVIAKNYIRDQTVVDDVGELIQAAAMAGLALVEVYRVHVGPGVTEQWKLARGKYNARTGAKHRVVEHEHVIVLRRR